MNLNFLILTLYCLIAALIGWYNSRVYVKSLKDYAVGYGAVSLTILTSGILASALGAGGIIGETEELFKIGVPLAFIETLRLVSWWLSSKLFTRNLTEIKSAECLSISHVMCYLYGPIARWITTALTIVTDLGIVTTQMMAVSYIINNFFALPQQLAALVAFILIMTFSLMGGIRTIAQTGLFQFGPFFLLFPVSY